MSENIHNIEKLRELQALPLDRKILISQARLMEWSIRWEHEVYVSLSGGKDSGVLATIFAGVCKSLGKTLYLVFVDTGLEYPEIRRHVKFFAQWLRNKYEIEVILDILRPDMRFDEVIKKYGYPLISKDVSDCVSQGRKALARGDGASNYRLLKIQGKALDKDGRPSLYNLKKYEPLLYTDFCMGSECCNVMKKKPAKLYAKRTGRKPITAQMADESRLRTQQWLKNGCNGFDMKSPISNPMSFWTDQDILQFIKHSQDEYDEAYRKKIDSLRQPWCHGGKRREIRKWLLREYESSSRYPLASVYGEIVEEGGKLVTTGCTRTGCMFCAFGCHLEKSPTRFEKLKETHPRQYEYCIGGGEYAWRAKVKTSNRWAEFDFINDNGEEMRPDEIEQFVEENCTDPNFIFEKIWIPNKQGLGLGHVFDELNYIYGQDFIKYQSRTEWLDNLLGGDL